MDKIAISGHRSDVLVEGGRFAGTSAYFPCINNYAAIKHLQMFNPFKRVYYKLKLDILCDCETT